MLVQGWTQCYWSAVALALLCCLAREVLRSMEFAQTELKAYCVDLSPCCFLPSFPPEASVQHSLQVSLHPDAVQTNRLQLLGKCAQDSNQAASTLQETAGILKQIICKKIKSLSTLKIQNYKVIHKQQRETD